MVLKLKLTSHEYKIIEYFLHHQDKVITRTELVEHIYDQDFDRDSNTIEVFIGRLRKKMGLTLLKLKEVTAIDYQLIKKPKA